MPSKWFGASSFGRQYLSALRVWVVLDGVHTPLDRRTQTGFTQALDSAWRTFEVAGCPIRQTFFVPDRIPAVAVTLEAGQAVTVIVEPQFDMRYYQAFNTDFSGYEAKVDLERLAVSNRIAGPSPTVPHLEFYASLAAESVGMRIDLLPANERLREKVYRVDEARERVIYSAYTETHERSPDEAPIWNSYATMVFAPAHLTATTPLTLVLGFGESEEEAGKAAAQTRRTLPTQRATKQHHVTERLEQAELRIGNAEADLAYAQILTRFDNCLVARDMTVRAGGDEADRKVNAIFAGNKYFLDPWKRDENIALIALLLTGDHHTARAILRDTWRFQDERTGRLPQIIRLGEPLVYYSSDGTLWALRRLYQYTEMSGDRSLLDEKYAMIEHFFTASLNFVQRGFLPSGGIVDRSYLWETWEDTPYTPRDGYPVEIELLWLTALHNYLPIIAARNTDLAGRLHGTLADGLQSMALFYLDGYLADSLSYQWEPRTILTPNGYMAFDLDVPLPPDLARGMVLLARDQLAGRVGVRSLAPRDWPRVLSKEFMADSRNFHDGDMASVGIYNYHRGIEWLWLNQFLVKGELLHGDREHAYDLYIRGLVREALHQGGVGGLSELYDLRGPLGADFQAWSMTGFIACLHAFVEHARKAAP
jgi:glycogen debranching enzyme